MAALVNVYCIVEDLLAARRETVKHGAECGKEDNIHEAMNEQVCHTKMNDISKTITNCKLP